jgi:hypothetical protein
LKVLKVNVSFTFADSNSVKMLYSQHDQMLGGRDGEMPKGCMDIGVVNAGLYGIVHSAILERETLSFWVTKNTAPTTLTIYTIAFKLSIEERNMVKEVETFNNYIVQLEERRQLQGDMFGLMVAIRKAKMDLANLQLNLSFVQFSMSQLKRSTIWEVMCSVENLSEWVAVTSNLVKTDTICPQEEDEEGTKSSSRLTKWLFG